MVLPVPGVIPSYHFGGASMPPKHARDILHERFLPNFDIGLPSSRPIRTSGAEHHGYMLGTAALLKRTMYAHQLHRTVRHVRHTQVDHYCLSLSLNQESPTRFTDDRGHTMEIPVGAAHLADMGYPMHYDFASGTDLALFIPRDDLDALLPRSLDLAGVLTHGPIATLLADHLRVAAETLGEMTHVEARLVTQATLHLIVAALAPNADTLALARPPMNHLLVRRIGRFVDARLDDPDLSIAQICTTFAMSRSTVYRLLEPFGGVAAFIRERRLTRVHRSLTDGANLQRLKRLADECGFKSASQLSRAFRQQFGYAPSEARLLAPMASPLGSTSKSTMPQLTAQQKHRFFAEWLASLHPG